MINCFLKLITTNYTLIIKQIFLFKKKHEYYNNYSPMDSEAEISLQEIFAIFKTQNIKIYSE